MLVATVRRPDLMSFKAVVTAANGIICLLILSQKGEQISLSPEEKLQPADTVNSHSEIAVRHFIYVE